MADKQVETLEGTRKAPIWTTVESGVKEDGTEWEKKQMVAPLTREECVTDEDNTPLSTKLSDILNRISKLSGGEYDILLQEIQQLKTSVQEFISAQEIMNREAMASYGYFGIEWDLDELMVLVRAGEWKKFAIGDYFIETTSSGEKIMWEVAGKNSYLHCGDTGLNKNHIVCCPRDCLETYYKYNETNTNAGGYGTSLMPANLKVEANKFSEKLQGYMITVRRLENNKGACAWASRRIFLPGIVELIGQIGFADGYSGGSFNQLPLFTGGNAHILKGAGFNKKKVERVSYWTADLVAANATSFCRFNRDGASLSSGAADDLSVAPLIVLS